MGTQINNKPIEHDMYTESVRIRAAPSTQLCVWPDTIIKTVSAKRTGSEKQDVISSNASMQSADTDKHNCGDPIFLIVVPQVVIRLNWSGRWSTMTQRRIHMFITYTDYAKNAIAMQLSCLYCYPGGVMCPPAQQSRVPRNMVELRKTARDIEQAKTYSQLDRGVSCTKQGQT